MFIRLPFIYAFNDQLVVIAAYHVARLWESDVIPVHARRGLNCIQYAGRLWESLSDEGSLCGILSRFPALPMENRAPAHWKTNRGFAVVSRCRALRLFLRQQGK